MMEIERYAAEYQITLEICSLFSAVLQAGEGLVAVRLLLLHAAALDGGLLHSDVQEAAQDL